MLDSDLKKIIGISTIVLMFDGFGALATMCESVFQIIVAFFPFICKAGKMVLEEY